MLSAQGISKLLSLGGHTGFPVSCIACGKTCSRAYSLCEPCAASLPWIQSCCRCCGMEYAEARLIDGCCATCLIHDSPIDFCRGLFRYQTPVKELLAAYKFHGRLEVGYALSRLLAQRVSGYYGRSAPFAQTNSHNKKHKNNNDCQSIMPGSNNGGQADSFRQSQCLIPVPLHRSRLTQRGFNQALEIARLLARYCHIPLQTKAVSRVIPTSAQASLTSARARRSNVKSAFNVAQPALLQNVYKVILIDDVVTTMATVKELASTLKSHGIREVDVWCLARSGR